MVIDGYLYGVGIKYFLSLESLNWKNWFRVYKWFYIVSE